jgi:hypothetical protein
MDIKKVDNILSNRLISRIPSKRKHGPLPDLVILLQMRIEKVDNILSNRLTSRRILRAPVSKTMAVALLSECLVASAQHHTLGFKFTAHGDDLVISSRIIFVTVDEEKRLESPAILACLTDQNYGV